MKGKKRNGKRKAWVALLAWATGVLLLSACAGKSQAKEISTPEETAEYALESLKALDLQAFNGCTDNYVRTYHNWIGIPREREYRVFGELQQPGFKSGKRYEANREFAEKIVEHMTWEIKEVREEEESAEVVLAITNRDLQNVVGELEIRILENMTEKTGMGIGQLIGGILDLTNAKEELLSIMDALDEEDVCTLEVTVLLYQEEGQWKIHVTDELVNAVMGNMRAEEYSEDIEKRIEEQMEWYEEKMEEWGESVEEWGMDT